MLLKEMKTLKVIVHHFIGGNFEFVQVALICLTLPEVMSIMIPRC